jgi:hypothetical protein
MVTGRLPAGLFAVLVAMAVENAEELVLLLGLGRFLFVASRLLNRGGLAGARVSFTPSLLALVRTK